MELRDLHPCWPEFDIKSKHYICYYQIDGKGSLPLSGHEFITPAHISNGNLARCWKSLYGASSAKEVGETHEQQGIWCLKQGERRIKLTIEYIDLQEVPPIPIDPTSIRHESGCSEQSKTLLDFLLQKLAETA